MAVLPADHRLAALTDVAFSELAEEPFVFATGGCGPLITEAATRTGVHLSVRFDAAHVASVVGMVASGRGVSSAPTLGLRHSTPGVVTRRLERKIRRMRALAVRSLSDASPQDKAFLATAAELE